MHHDCCHGPSQPSEGSLTVGIQLVILMSSERQTDIKFNPIICLAQSEDLQRFEENTVSCLEQRAGIRFFIHHEHIFCSLFYCAEHCAVEPWVNAIIIIIINATWALLTRGSSDLPGVYICVTFYRRIYLLYLVAAGLVPDKLEAWNALGGADHSDIFWMFAVRHSKPIGMTLSQALLSTKAVHIVQPDTTWIKGRGECEQKISCCCFLGYTVVQDI